MVEFSPLPIGIATDAGMVEYLNPKFIETFGYTIEDMPQLVDWYGLAYPDAAYRQKPEGEVASSAGKSGCQEFRHPKHRSRGGLQGRFQTDHEDLGHRWWGTSCW